MSAITVSCGRRRQRRARCRSLKIEGDYSWQGDVYIDCDKIQRGIENILRNAFEVLEPGGVISVRSTSRDDMAQIIISDNGPGIPDDIIRQLFEPFVTHGKREGTGLGLAVAKKVVEDHNGSIDAKNQEGGEARFIISLPIHKPEITK